MINRRQLLIGSGAAFLLGGRQTSAGLMVGQPVDSVFNNGRSQLNFNFTQFGGAFPFINALKDAQSWILDGIIGAPAPDTLSSKGYPTDLSIGGVQTVFYTPTSTQRPGNWTLRWTGTGTVTAAGGGGEATDGEYTFAPEQVVLPPGNRVVLKITSGTNISNIEFFHEDDTDLIDSGQIFNTAFLNVLRAGRWGVLRFLDWQMNNTTNVVKWENRKPLDYAYWSGQQFVSDIYGGVTANSGDDYTVAAPPNWGGLSHNAIVTVKYNASASSTSPTLNVNGTGAKIIRDPSGDELYPETRPLAGRFGTLIYNGVLDCWLQFGGDGASFDGFIINGIPIEVMLALCEEIGAHPWFCPPYLSCDPITDWTSSLATYLRENAPSWMIPRFEACPNETWNFAGGFNATKFADNLSDAHWGSPNYHQWVGKVASLQGQAVSAVYGADRNRYWSVLGVQTHSFPPNSDPRLTSEDYVSEDGGEPAYDWVTHVCCANYYNPTYTSGEANAAATAYAAADPAGKVTIATAYVESTLVDLGGDQYQFSVPRLIGTIVPAWKAWAEGFGVMGFTFYEGGWSPDYVAGQTDLNALKSGSRMVSELAEITFDLYDALIDLGCEFPSHYYLSGTGVWALFDPTIYETPSPQIDGITTFNS